MYQLGQRITQTLRVVAFSGRLSRADLILNDVGQVFGYWHPCACIPTSHQLNQLIKSAVCAQRLTQDGIIEKVAPDWGL
jgi:hypothetical protein